MFGYVTIGKNQLTEAEYEIFNSYYCGLCRAIGKRASQTARLGLSFDITFLAMVLSSVCSESRENGEGRCIPHPKKKRTYIKNDPVIDYAAEMGVLLDFLKLADDLRDERSIKAFFGMLLLWRGYARVKRKCKEQYDVIKSELDRLSRLESEGCAIIDEAADAFAKITEALFVPSFVEGDNFRRALAWFGYNLGRWIYIIDAYNDFDDDIKSGSYNPLIAAGNRDKSECAAGIELSLTLTLGNVASAFELIDFKQNKDIIGKIVYISLKDKQKSILEKRKNKERVN